VVEWCDHEILGLIFILDSHLLLHTIFTFLELVWWPWRHPLIFYIFLHFESAPTWGFLYLFTLEQLGYHFYWCIWFSFLPMTFSFLPIYVFLFFVALKGWILLQLYSVAAPFPWKVDFVINSLRILHKLWGSLFHNFDWVLFWFTFCLLIS